MGSFLIMSPSQLSHRMEAGRCPQTHGDSENAAGKGMEYFFTVSGVMVRSKRRSSGCQVASDGSAQIFSTRGCMTSTRL